MRYQYLINLLVITLLLILSGVMSVIWHGVHSPYILQTVMSGFSDIPMAASAMSSPPEPYFYFGRFTLLFYIVIFLHISQIKNRINSSVVFISKLLLSVAFIGDVGTYWLSDIYGVCLRTIAFWYVEFPALVLLLTYWFSLASYQSLKLRKLHSMLWILPLSIIAIGFIQYFPHSFLLVILNVVSFKCFTRYRCLCNNS